MYPPGDIEIITNKLYYVESYNKWRRRRIKTLLSTLLVLLFSAAAGFAQPFAYVSNFNSSSISVIDTATNTVVDTISPLDGPRGVAVSPDGARVFVATDGDDTVSVIRTSDNTVIDTVTVGDGPQGVAITPDGARVYVVNYADDTVTVINALTNAVIDTVTVGDGPGAFGIFIQPAQEPIISGTVPTLSEWGAIAFALLTGMSAVIFLRKRKAVRA